MGHESIEMETYDLDAAVAGVLGANGIVCAFAVEAWLVPVVCLAQGGAGNGECNDG